MRLTQALKAAYVQAAIRDVPQVDYAAKARDLAVQDVLKHKMPAVVLEAYRKHPEWVRTRVTQYGQLPYGHLDIAPSNMLSAGVKAQIAMLDIEAENQRMKLKSLERQLKAAVAACTTAKQLAALIPEFAKYLPREQEKLEFPVAVVNPLADFVKAGWKSTTKA